MTHPLTDKDIQSIWDKVGNDIVDAKDEDLDGFVEDALIRAGADWQLEQVSKWLDDNVGMLLLCAEPGVGDRYLESLKDEFIQSFIETMRPQEDN